MKYNTIIISRLMINKKTLKTFVYKHNNKKNLKIISTHVNKNHLKVLLMKNHLNRATTFMCILEHFLQINNIQILEATSAAEFLQESADNCEIRIAFASGFIVGRHLQCRLYLTGTSSHKKGNAMGRHNTPIHKVHMI